MKYLLPLLVLLAASCTSRPNQPAPPPPLNVGNYKTDVGPTPVGVIPTAPLHDAQRNKDVDLSIEYPTRGGPFPVILFSHGYGSSNQAYEPLISYWTSNGYVCIRPAHADAGAIRDAARELTVPPRQQPGSRRQARPQPPVQPPQQQGNPMEEIWEKEREPQWRDRAADLELVLDSLDELERRFPELRGKMDRPHIGVAGHSYGAFSAMLVAGMRTFGNPPLQIGDPRVRAVIAMSPQGVAANRGTTAQSWTDIKIPMMFMTGTNDRGANESEDATWRQQAFDYSPAGDKYFVLIEGGRHLSFTGAMTPIGQFTEMRPPQATPRDPYATATPTPQQRGGAGFASERRIFQIIKITSLAFWDAHLKNEPAARELLQPQKYEASFGGAHMTSK